jgi:hypothetical protein
MSKGLHPRGRRIRLSQPESALGGGPNIRPISQRKLWKTVRVILTGVISPSMAQMPLEIDNDGLSKGQLIHSIIARNAEFGCRKKLRLATALPVVQYSKIECQRPKLVRDMSCDYALYTIRPDKSAIHYKQACCLITTRLSPTMLGREWRHHSVNSHNEKRKFSDIHGHITYV